MEIEFKKKPVRSYVIRGGRITGGQKKAFDRWWPEYGLSLHTGQMEPGTIFERQGPLVMEIGFGMGDSLLDLVKTSAETNFIGVEVHPPGVGRLMNNAGKLGLANLKVYMADALDVLADCIPDNALDRLQLFVPDPWHKKKHNKRRIVQPEFVSLVRRKLKTGGTIHLATDWEEYAENIMEIMCSAEGFCNMADEYQYSPTPAYRPQTKFEKRGRGLGHGVWDILFRKVC